MKIVALFLSGALWILCLLFCFAAPGVFAQVTPEGAAARTATPDEVKQAELLKAFLDAREQLHTTQLAIASSRVEAAGEKVEIMRKTIEHERERQHAELQRVATASDRRLAEMERSQRAIVWAAASFGVAGLFAMLMMPVMQARILRHAIQPVSDQQVVPVAKQTLLSAERAADESVSAATEKLLAMIGRVERRINDLEQTATSATAAVTAAPMPAPSTGSTQMVVTTAGPGTTNGFTTSVDPSRRGAADRAAADRNAWIELLVSKGRSLLSAGKPQEAITCFDEILRFSPRNAEVLVTRGAAMERLNRFEDALDSYEQAIEADGEMTLAHLSKGAMCNRLGRFDEAIKAYERALRIEQKVS